MRIIGVESSAVKHLVVF